MDKTKPYIIKQIDHVPGSGSFVVHDLHLSLYELPSAVFGPATLRECEAYIANDTTHQHA